MVVLPSKPQLHDYIIFVCYFFADENISFADYFDGVYGPCGGIANKFIIT